MHTHSHMAVKRRRLGNFEISSVCTYSRFDSPYLLHVYKYMYTSSLYTAYFDRYLFLASRIWINIHMCLLQLHIYTHTLSRERGWKRKFLMKQVEALFCLPFSLEKKLDRPLYIFWCVLYFFYLDLIGIIFINFSYFACVHEIGFVDLLIIWCLITFIYIFFFSV